MEELPKVAVVVALPLLTAFGDTARGDVVMIPAERLQGTLDACEDPETGHPLVITFRGEIAGDSIGESFTSYDRVAERRAGGTWFVRRESP